MLKYQFQDKYYPEFQKFVQHSFRLEYDQQKNLGIFLNKATQNAHDTVDSKHGAAYFLPLIVSLYQDTEFDLEPFSPSKT